MATSEVDPQEFGQMKEQIAGLRRDQDRQTQMLERLILAVDTMGLRMAEAGGGWKVLTALTSVAGGLGAALTWVAAHFAGGPKP